MADTAARVIAGRYRLMSQLGRGGMGVVWQARDELLNRDVAIKEIHFPYAGTGQPDLVARRALREARAAAQLRHRGIITVHDVVTAEGRPWIVMELIRGRSLHQAITADGPMPPAAAAAVALQVLDALKAAHRQGILHRDVKPANILMADDGVVLTDFGIAAMDGATGLTATGQIVGSPEYLAPERISGQPATSAADLWGLGVTLYTALTGRSPFHREDARTTLAAVLASEPEPVQGPLWPVVRRLLEKDPQRRLTAAGATPLLTAAAESQPSRQPRAIHPSKTQPSDVPAPSPASPPPTSPTADKRLWERVAEIGAAPVLVLLILGVAAWFVLHQPPDDRDDGTAAPSIAASAATTGAGPSASPSKAWTPPPAPRGFRTVYEAGYTVAVPNDWAASPLSSGWQGPGGPLPNPLLKVEVSYAGRKTPVPAQSLLSLEDKNERRLRSANLPTIEGTGSVAEVEYTVTKPDQLILGHQHEIKRVLVTKAGTGAYTVVVMVHSNTASGLRRSWATHRPALIKILNSVRLTPQG